jgi:hypothetical protein
MANGRYVDLTIWGLQGQGQQLSNFHGPSTGRGSQPLHNKFISKSELFTDSISKNNPKVTQNASNYIILPSTYHKLPLPTGFPDRSIPKPFHPVQPGSCTDAGGFESPFGSRAVECRSASGSNATSETRCSSVTQPPGSQNSVRRKLVYKPIQQNSAIVVA